jgi:molybdopterin-guanine dinucleotide biosynthesis protein A
MTITDDALSTLKEQLGEDPPPAVARLDPEQLHDLAAAVHEARRRQAAELAAAGEQAFAHVPRLLRGPIRKVLR